jgi:hypothetical protein
MKRNGVHDRRRSLQRVLLLAGVSLILLGTQVVPTFAGEGSSSTSVHSAGGLDHLETVIDEGRAVSILPPDNLATQYPQPEPVLSARFRDTAGGRGRVLYTIVDLAGDIVVRDLPGAVVQSGQESPVTVPSGSLEDGVLYRWRARSFNGVFYSRYTTEPAYVATSVDRALFSADGSALTSTPAGNGDVGTLGVYGNPWGCDLLADNPHWSVHTARIAAQARTVCWVVPPTTYIRHYQELFRSSWSGWRYVGENWSVCDAGTANSGQSTPDCRPSSPNPRMRSWVSWNCVGAGFYGGWYNYRQVVSGAMLAQGTWYYAADARQTGSWNETGKVLCGGS